MILQRIKRKLYKATHPVVGEIWMLHRVVKNRSEKPEQRELEVTPEWLEEHIVSRQEEGYEFVSLDEIYNKKHWICITFDDGYQDNYTLAYPILKRMGIPFTVYVTTGFIDNRIPMWWYPGEQLGISSANLIEMDRDPLCTIGAHTVSHPKLDTLSYENQYQEIADSKYELESLLGHEICQFSFPHGAHNNDTLDICKKMDFHTVTQSWGGTFRCGERYYPMPRIEMKQDD